jgi:putative transposase
MQKNLRWPEFADALKPFYYKPYFWNHAYALISGKPLGSVTRLLHGNIFAVTVHKLCYCGRTILETLLKHIVNQDDPRKLG